MKKSSAVFLSFLFILLHTLSLPNSAYAQNVICSGSGIDTAIGCIRILGSGGGGDVALANFFIVWGMGIGGGIAFLLVIYAGFLIMTSTGNPQRLSAGKELLTAALSGLLLIIFSAFLLRVIGVDILGLFP